MKPDGTVAQTELWQIWFRHHFKQEARVQGWQWQQISWLPACLKEWKVNEWLDPFHWSTVWCATACLHLHAYIHGRFCRAKSGFDHHWNHPAHVEQRVFDHQWNPITICTLSTLVFAIVDADYEYILVHHSRSKHLRPVLISRLGILANHPSQYQLSFVLLSYDQATKYATYAYLYGDW